SRGRGGRPRRSRGRGRSLLCGARHGRALLEALLAVGVALFHRVLEGAERDAVGVGHLLGPLAVGLVDLLVARVADEGGRGGGERARERVGGRRARRGGGGGRARGRRARGRGGRRRGADDGRLDLHGRGRGGLVAAAGP